MLFDRVVLNFILDSPDSVPPSVANISLRDFVKVKVMLGGTRIMFSFGQERSSCLVSDVGGRKFQGASAVD